MLEVPREIWIAGTRFAISLEKSDAVFGTWGYVTMDSPCTVMIRHNLDPQIRRETLLHETIHALDKLGVDFDNSIVRALKGAEYPRLMENHVTVFSRLLWATLSDPRNRETVAWMLSTPA